MVEQRTDVPPTAGLPLCVGDLAWPRARAASDLGAALARFLGVAQVQIECSGTACLVVALTALRRLAPTRTEVVVPAYTCPLVALAVARCGLQLRVCDLQHGTLDLDPVHLRQLCGPQTLALVPTHLGGRVSDVATAQACARAVGAWTLEDAAQALGARVGRQSVGAHSDLVFFSLAVGKGLTLFEGGALVVHDPALRRACEQASAEIVGRHRGWELRRSLELLGYALCYRPALLGLVYGRPLRHALRRGDWVAAAGDDVDPEIPLHRVGRWRQAVGVRALERLPDFLARGSARALQRREQLRRVTGLSVLGDSPSMSDASGVWPVLMVRMPSAAQRDAAIRALWGAGCGLSLPFVHALPDYPRYAGVVPAAEAGALPHARDLASRLLAVSNSPWLDDARFEQVCAALATFSR